MAFVQGSHRGDQAHNVLASPRAARNLLHPFNCADDFHGRVAMDKTLYRPQGLVIQDGRKEHPMRKLLFLFAVSGVLAMAASRPPDIPFRIEMIDPGASES